MGFLSGTSYREKWWLFAEPRPDLRAAVTGLKRYIASPMTAKHRTFQFLDREFLPDQGLVVVASASAEHHGYLSSRLHVEWALSAGARLGVGNDPRYNNSRCFETFPFPSLPAVSEQLRKDIAKHAEHIDAHRKRQIAAHPGLTLTGIYNVLEALRTDRPLTAKEKAINEQGLVSLLKLRHDELDLEVLAAYGWSDLAPAFANGPLDEAAPDPAGASGRAQRPARG